MNTIASVIPKPPVYCKDCNTANSWERKPARDWITESGKVFEYAYKCKACGAFTLSPNPSNNTTSFTKDT